MASHGRPLSLVLAYMLFYEMLLSKVMTNSNLLEHYIPKQITHHLYKDFEEETPDGSDPRKTP
jgi:hypothetical protein